MPVRSPADLRLGWIFVKAEVGRAGWFFLKAAKPALPCGHVDWTAMGGVTLNGCKMETAIRRRAVFRLADDPSPSPAEEDIAAPPGRITSRAGSE